MSKHHFLSSFLLCGLLGITGTIATISLHLPSAIAQTIPTDENQDAIAEQLYGFWEVVNFAVEEAIYIWFSPNGELAILDFRNSSVQVDRYQINTTARPMQLDILHDLRVEEEWLPTAGWLSEKELVLTIFKLLPSGQLLLDSGDSDRFRPKEFSTTTIRLEKLSDNDPIVPQLQARIEAEIAEREREEAQRIASMEAIGNLGIMSRAQQAYHLESPNFAETLDELQLGFPAESEQYRYEILPQTNRPKGVIMTATAKQPGLFGYTSFVYVYNERGSTTALMCQTNESSTVPPEILIDLTDILQPVRCGEGSHLWP